MRSSTRQSRMPRPALLLLLAGALLIVVFAAISLGGRSGGPSAAPPALTLAPGPDGVLRIELAEAEQLWRSGSAVFVDVRAPEDYAAAHIPGALSIPLWELPDRRGELDPQAWIITYCT